MTSLAELESALAKDNGARLRARRRELQMTQGELAKAIGILQRRLSTYETGQRPIPDSLKVLAAKALRTKVRALFPLEVEL